MDNGKIRKCDTHTIFLIAIFIFGTLLRKTNFRGYTGDFRFDKNGEREGNLHFIYRTLNNQFQNLGSYNNETGLKLHNGETFMRKNKNTDQIELTVTTIIAAPYIIQKSTEDNSVKLEGFCIDCK